jgi:hypothetical protein
MIFYTIEDVLRGQFIFRRGKGTRNAIGILRIISEQTLDIDAEMCVCFTDRKQTFDQLKWTKLMHIIKKTDINWHKRRLISKLYIDQSAKLSLDQGETEG